MIKLKTKMLVIPTYNKGQSLNQCGNVSLINYICTVTVYATDTLNARGFVIDHGTIRQVIDTCFKTPILSCEDMAVKIGTVVKNTLIHEAVGFYRVHVKLKPASKDPYKFGTITYIKTFQQP